MRAFGPLQLLLAGGRKETEGAWKVAAATREGRAAEHTASCWRRALLLLAATGPLRCRATGHQGDWLLLVEAWRHTETGSPAKLRRDKAETAAVACMLPVPAL